METAGVNTGYQPAGGGAGGLIGMGAAKSLSPRTLHAVARCQAVVWAIQIREGRIRWLLPAIEIAVFSPIVIAKRR
ncbi:hypothetical protein GCM10023333_10700 [Ferrimonas pelagia]|uniref:Uncharacterized protein n=1 Tax=Ferrimonas pelagia TaxID=1177826 RepID=A0ABP9EGS2_9GAMM